MSQENVEVVRQVLAAWKEVDSGLSDRQRLTEFIAPDVTWDLGTFSGWPDRREFHGLDEFIEWRDSWTEPYEEWSYEAERILDAGGSWVVATFYQRGKPRGSGSWVDLRYAIVYTVESGLIRRGQAYASAEEALEAAGLSE